MSRDILFFTLSLLALYIVFDQFIGNKNLSKLADSLWNNNRQTENTVTATNM